MACDVLVLLNANSDSEPDTEAFLSSCSAEQRANLSPVYIETASELWPIIWSQPAELPGLLPPNPPQDLGQEGADAAVNSIQTSTVQSEHTESQT